MKKIILIYVALSLSGCVGTETITGFAPMIKPDGSQAFRFVMEPGAAEIYGSEEKAREELLGQQLGSRNYCQNGYTITSRKLVSDKLIYEGYCK